MLGLEYIPKQQDTDISTLSKWINLNRPDFLIIPDSPNSRPTPEACMISLLWREKLGVDVIASIAGSGRRQERIESLLMGLLYAQISKVAVVGGDARDTGNLSGIEMIKKAKEILGASSTIISGSKAVLDFGEKEKLKAKLENGADIIITQPIFEREVAQRFLDDFDGIAKESKALAMINFFPIYDVSFCDKLKSANLGFDIPSSYKSNIQNNAIKANLALYKELSSLGASVHISGAKNSFLESFFSSYKDLE